MIINVGLPCLWCIVVLLPQKRFFERFWMYLSSALHIPNSGKGNCLTEKENHTLCLKINKFANYQNIIVRNSTAFDCHVFVSSEDRWFMVFDVMRMISTQIRRQDPCWSLPSCENIVWNVWEVAPPPPPLVPGVPRHCTLRTFHGSWAQFIQPKFPKISVQNSMDRFGPTGKVSKKLVHLLRWTTFPGRTGWKIWMNGPRP